MIHEEEQIDTGKVILKTLKIRVIFQYSPRTLTGLEIVFEFFEFCVYLKQRVRIKSWHNPRKKVQKFEFLWFMIFRMQAVCIKV